MLRMLFLNSLLARMTSRWNSMAIRLQTSGIFLGFFKIESGLMTLRNLRVEHNKQSFLDRADDDINAVYRVEEHDIVLDQDEKFYLQLVNLTGMPMLTRKIVLRVISVLRRCDNGIYNV